MRSKYLLFIMDQELSANLFDIDYFKVRSRRSMKNPAFHEKKEKNRKINLGGPKKRHPKYGPKHKTLKPARPRL